MRRNVNITTAMAIIGVILVLAGIGCGVYAIADTFGFFGFLGKVSIREAAILWKTHPIAEICQIAFLFIGTLLVEIAKNN